MFLPSEEKKTKEETTTFSFSFGFVCLCFFQRKKKKVGIKKRRETNTPSGEEKQGMFSFLFPQRGKLLFFFFFLFSSKGRNYPFGDKKRCFFTKGERKSPQRGVIKLRFIKKTKGKAKRRYSLEVKLQGFLIIF